MEGAGAEELLGGPVKEVGAQRIVVDSMSHISMFIPDGELRKEASRMVMYFKTNGLSSLLLWESQQENGHSFSATDNGLSFLVDSIVLLKYIEIESSIRRAMVVLKMRGSDHDKRLREYQITPQGIRLEAALTQYQGLMSGSPTKVGSEKFFELFGKAAKER